MGAYLCLVGLVSVADIASMLGVSRRQVHRLASQPDFPAPAQESAVGRLWRRRDIEEWSRDRRRPGGQEKPYRRKG